MVEGVQISDIEGEMLTDREEPLKKEIDYYPSEVGRLNEAAAIKQRKAHLVSICKSHRVPIGFELA